MFTGIIESIGTVSGMQKGRKPGVTLVEIKAPRVSRGIKIGASLAVDGTCLTVTAKKGSKLFFHIVRETKRRSTLGLLKAGAIVNLERPLRASDRIEGHFVLGHIDAMGKVLRVTSAKREKSFLISYPKSLSMYMIEKGSIAINGVSLTIGKVENRAFWIHCIPHTLEVTNLHSLTVGSSVNLEADILIKLAAGLIRGR